MSAGVEDLLMRRLRGGEGGNRVAFSHADIARILQHYGLGGSSPVAATARAVPPVSVKAPPMRGVPDKTRQHVFIVSSDRIDWMLDRVDVNGWDLSTFKSNPTVLYGHQGAAMPIGRAVATWLQNGKLLSTVQLARTPRAEEVHQLILDGHLSAASVGFVPTAWTFSTDASRPMGLDIKTATLLEWSIVATPANADCLLVESAAAPTPRSLSLPRKDASAEARRREVARLKAGPPLLADRTARAAAIEQRRREIDDLIRRGLR